MPSPPNRGIALLIAGILTLAAWAIWRARSEWVAAQTGDDHGFSPPDPPASIASSLETREALLTIPSVAPNAPGDSRDGGDANASGEPVIDRARRDAMRTLIWRAFGRPVPIETTDAKQRYVLPVHGPEWSPDDLTKDSEPGIEPQYIQDSVRQQFFPVARKCYAESPATSVAKGEIDLWFVIVGDAKIGGIVESVDVLDKSTLRDPDFIECMRQSFLGVTFPPPKGGGMVTVEYPIRFSPEDEDGG